LEGGIVRSCPTATEYSATTGLVNDDIAVALGVSDATGVRLASGLWTLRTPAKFGQLPG
jgi:hypothetical protein